MHSKSALVYTHAFAGVGREKSSGSYDHTNLVKLTFGAGVVINMHCEPWLAARTRDYPHELSFRECCDVPTMGMLWTIWVVVRLAGDLFDDSGSTEDLNISRRSYDLQVRV